MLKCVIVQHVSVSCSVLQCYLCVRWSWGRRPVQSVLQCLTVCCSVLQHVAECCSVLHYHLCVLWNRGKRLVQSLVLVSRPPVLQCVAVCCNICLCMSLPCCSVLEHSFAQLQCCILQHVAVRFKGWYRCLRHAHARAINSGATIYRVSCRHI